MKKIPFITFIILFSVITIVSMVKPEKAFSENENRLLTRKPEFSPDAFFAGTYTTQYEEYISDQFILRDRWIELKTDIELVLGKKLIGNVFIGKDGYLFEKKSMNDIDSEQAEKNISRLSEFISKYVKILGKKRVYAMLVPTAPSVMDEKLPDHAITYTGDDYIDTAVGLIGDNFIDCREILYSHDKEPVYYRTDHHWTTLGSYYAYSEWARKTVGRAFPKENFRIVTVADDFYGTLSSKINIEKKADSIQAYLTNNVYKVTYNDNYDMNGKPMEPQESLYNYEALNTKDKYSFFLRGNNAVVEIDKELDPEMKNKRTLLIIKDSYAHCFTPFTTMHFDKVYMIDFRYLNEPVSQFIERNAITDILVLYNVLQFAEDTNSSKFLK